MLINVSIEDQIVPSEWDNFVASCSNGTIFHVSAWKRVLEMQGLRSAYFVARDGQGSMLSACPFFLVSILGGIASSLISLPKSDIGGPIFKDGSNSAEIGIHLMKAIKRTALMRRIPLAVAAVADSVASKSLSFGNVTVSSTSGFFVLDLDRLAPEAIWSSFSHSGRQRTEISRMDRDGFTFYVGDSHTDLSEFYMLYRTTVQRAGGKAYPYSLFSCIMSLMHPRNFNLLMVRKGDRPVGGLGVLCYPEKKQLHTMYAAYDRSAGNRYPVHLYTNWKALLWARACGYRYINFGTTSANPLDGNYRFKQQFGGRFVRKVVVKQLMVPNLVGSLIRRVNQNIQFRRLLYSRTS